MMESFTVEEKREISKSIKNITIDKVNKDWLTLKNIDTQKLNNKCNSGLSVVDYFTFEERLHTKGKYNVNFFEFTQNIEEFKKKRFIQTMFNFYHKVKNIKGKKNEYVVQKEIYNICITAINAFKPTIAMHVFSIYSPKSVLDFCCGWGGRLVGACALNVKSFIGIEINKNLEKPYVEMQEYLETCSSTEIQILIEDALNTDYSKLIYDMVLTSPPYFFLEKYRNNSKYKNKTDMIDNFYIPLFRKTFHHLQANGVYCLNVNNDIYQNICLPLLGEAINKIPMIKSQRQNNYGEYIYVWKKNV